jgi:hypothetical protein
MMQLLQSQVQQMVQRLQSSGLAGECLCWTQQVYFCSLGDVAVASNSHPGVG